MDIGQFTLHATMEDRHWWFVGRRELIFEILRRYVSPNNEKHILEIGCGTGGNLRFLGKFYRVTGMDIAPEAVRHARERVDCPILNADFGDTYSNVFTDVDAVLLADVLEHVEDDRGFLSDILMRLRSGGVVVITVPAYDFLWSNHDIVLGHVRRYSRKQLLSIRQGLPVDMKYCTSFNSLFFPLIALYRLLPHGASRESDLTLPPAPINNLLLALFRLEKFLLKIRPLPWGVSLMMVLQKR